MSRRAEATESRPRSSAMDAARAGAAVLVLISHARDLSVVDADRASSHGWGAEVFYAATGLGHQAVIVFFVISGALVTQSMLRSIAAGRWSLGAYAIARLTRLWVVLLPILVIVAGLDRLALVLGSSGIDGEPYGWIGSAGTAATFDTSLSAWIGNAVFLQTILVPPYGSDGPLWSLAYEAWYYVVAGLLCAAWQARRTRLRWIVPIAAASSLAFVLPPAIVMLAPAWACGALFALLKARAASPTRAGTWQKGASGAVFLVCVLSSRARLGDHRLLLDYGLAISAAWLLHAFDRAIIAASLVRGIQWLAARSYSLYLSHCPVIAFVTALSLGPHRLAFSSGACFWVVGLSITAIACADALWWCFERHTDRVRGWMASNPRFRSRRVMPLAIASGEG